MPNRPVVLVCSRRTIRKGRIIDYVGELHLALLVQLRLLPIMIPVVEGTPNCLPQYMEKMSGLLLVEGEDIHPSRYRAKESNFTHLEKTHPLKDEIELRLLRRALRDKFPVLGICRGSQLLNVVCGGTLYGDVQKEIHSAAGSKNESKNEKGREESLKHIEEPGPQHDTYRHPITPVEGTPLSRWYGEKTLQVNSFHHQGVRELAKRFRPMAHAPDGLIEAFYDPKSDFAVGLQFHPERMLPDYTGNSKVWRAFGAAVHRRAKSLKV